MNRRLKILILIFIVFSIMVGEAYILKSGKGNDKYSSLDQALSIPQALAQTSGTILNRPSCSQISDGTSTGGFPSFVCMGNLDGSGNGTVIVGTESGCGAFIVGALGWCFTIIHPDGTKTVVQ